MYLDPIRVIKDTNPLTTPTIIPVDHGINHRFTEHLNGVLRDIHPLPPFNTRAHSDIAIKKCLGAIYDFLKRPCHDFAISIAAGPNSFSK